MTERILNQNGVEISGQKRYAENGGKNMAGIPAPEQQVNQPNEKRIEGPPKKPEPEISPDKAINEQAKKAVREFAKEKVAKEMAKTPQRVEAHQELINPTKQDVKKYIPDVVPTTMNNAINEFYKEYAKQVGEPTTDFLVTQYLKLKDAAGQKATEFLSKFRNELTRLGVNVKALDSYSEEAIEIEKDWRKLQEEGKITAEDAERMIKARLRLMKGGQDVPHVNIPSGVSDDVRGEISALNAKLRAYGEDDFEAYEKALENIAKIEPRLTGEQQEAAHAVIEDLIQRVGHGHGERNEAEKQHRAQEEKYRKEREERGLYHERLITDENIKMVKETLEKIVRESSENTPMNELLKKLEEVDKLFNRMFDRAEANPRAEFKDASGPAGQQEYSHWITMLNDVRADFTGDIQKEALVKKLTERYAAEYKLRELLHNAFYIAETGGEAKQFSGYTTQFQSEFADLAFLGAPEVEVAFRIREQVLYQIKRENNGTIPYEKVAYIPDKGWSEWERRSEKLLHEANDAKVFGEEKLHGWKLDRALSISRGMGMVLLRFPEIVAECPLRAGSDQYEGQPSIPWETISWELNPLDHKIKRYDIGKEMAAILYANVARKKGRKMWNQDELRDAYNLKTFESMALMNEEGEERMIDMRNLTKIGGWATHSGWRSYISALEGDQSGLRPLLDKNPGIAMRLLWNRYLINDFGQAKKEFIASYRVINPGSTDQVVQKAWEERKKELGDQKKNWENADIETWKGSARRIPHVILRIITDQNNKLISDAKRREMLRGIFGNLEGEAFQNAYTQLENDLTLAKENLMKRRRAKGKDFTENEDMLINEDFNTITDVVRQKRARDLFRIVTSEIDSNTDLQKKILEKVATRGFPFAITNEDVPFSEYKFAQTGGRGLITRRNNDWFQEVQANDAIIEMIKHLNAYQSPDQILEQLHKIYDLSEVHDRDRANDLIEYLAIGLIRFYQKDGALKVPLYGEFMGMFNAMKHRGNSFAQTIYGGKAMDLEADDIWYFTEQLRTILVGKDGLERIDRIRKETGGTLPRSILKKTKVALYLLLLFGSYQWAQSILKEK